MSLPDFDLQRRYFHAGNTRDIAFRKGQLQKLLLAVREWEPRILKAMKEDLGKPETESFLSEVAFVTEDIRHTLKHLDSWAKPKKVWTPLAQAPARSTIHTEPKGVVLIIAPWNYPFQLAMAPLIGALAAGNCIVVKPSELTPKTAELIQAFMAEVFSPELATCVLGGAETTQELLGRPWDHIFFTGSTRVGKIVMEAAAKFLTPVTLELGGKSPCIIDESSYSSVSFRRITWGKFFNAGQTCVAPDYLLVPESQLKPVVEGIRGEIKRFFGDRPKESGSFARIVSDAHYQRLERMLGDGTVVIGGEKDRESRFIAPSVIVNPKLGSALMQEEIFGPLLPILTYQKFDEALDFVKSRPKPLACYFFSSSPERQKRVMQELSYGGGCINDTLVHLANPNLPFGGIGDSGMGAYHGKFSFDVFSHRKSVLHRGTWPDPALRYPPYGKWDKVLRWLFP